MKKKLSISMVLFICCIVSAQRIADKIDPNFSGALYRNGSLNSTYHEKTEGSPYLNEKFNYAEVSGIDQKLMVRYNAESDQIEVQIETNDVLILTKDDKFNLISINLGLTKMKLLNYKNLKGEDVYGYLVVLFDKNEVSLLRRDKIILQKEKQPKNSYDVYSPAKLVKANEEYYLETKDKKIIPMPQNKKQLLELYPEQKEAIIPFLKNNDLSFKTESDLIKITQFLSTL
ncbi:hypothetical protein [Flavobacterium psychrotolerans]|uniref:Secreted protein n=1 Tax=Flavobacterium psychrotolerans TaxID=2169410 RepID=A0A2U1JNS6_9FLAO|nr:hypothetical protein [Flavobacterium psychrotolerans]PWA06830.1 hypothetical protein DB895_02270 [Flavobacterium psychrotolerans]